MTTFEAIDKAIASRGIRYDVGDELFYDGTRPLEPKELVKLLPGFTLDELASYQDDKHDYTAKPAARPAKKQTEKG